MLKMNIDEYDKKIYVNVSGYVSSDDAYAFLKSYKQSTNNLKKSQYKLIVIPSLFDYESEKDIRNICMTFYKTGYKKMYLVDPKNYIMGNLVLGPLEKKMFLKVVKVVSSEESVL